MFVDTIRHRFGFLFFTRQTSLCRNRLRKFVLSLVHTRRSIKRIDHVVKITRSRVDTDGLDVELRTCRMQTIEFITRCIYCWSFETIKKYEYFFFFNWRKLSLLVLGQYSFAITPRVVRRPLALGLDRKYQFRTNNTNIMSRRDY